MARKRKQRTEEGNAKRGCHSPPEGDQGSMLAMDPERIKYRVEGGLRQVEPYDFDFATHVKQRWVGRTLLDVFTSEFVAFSAAYYEASIQAGRVTVDGRTVSTGHVLRDGERIVHRAVRCRENPVLDCGPVSVVANTADMLVVSKPSSLPIHPCGSYRFNSLLVLLRAQGVVDRAAELHPTHRLDRLTSGLVIFAKNKAAARQVGTWFSSGKIRKTYLARVRGHFGDLIGSLALSGRSGAGETAGTAADGTDVKNTKAPFGATWVSDGRIRLEGFIRCVDHKVGKYVFCSDRQGEDPETKDSATEFELVRITPCGESIVRCYPETGRTHQIRVHLQHLGFPIANDTCYGGELRSDASLPLIPHVHQARKGETGEEVEETAETMMHPSGIYLHALKYCLPNEEYATPEEPPWAGAE